MQEQTYYNKNLNLEVDSMANYVQNVSSKDQPMPQKLYLENRNAPEQPMFPVFQSTSHPFLAAQHLLLKAGIVAAYLLLPLLVKSLTSMEIVVIFAAIDFWIVKNVTGRLLVGLRWWVDFDEEGEESWMFQCKVNEKDVNPASDKVFWWTLLLFSVIWVALTVFNILRLDITNVVICVFCAAMLIFNLYSYYKCSKAQAENLKKLAFQYGAQAVGQFMRGSIVANYF